MVLRTLSELTGLSVVPLQWDSCRYSGMGATVAREAEMELKDFVVFRGGAHYFTLCRCSGISVSIALAR